MRQSSPSAALPLPAPHQPRGGSHSARAAQSELPDDGVLKSDLHKLSPTCCCSPSSATTGRLYPAGRTGCVALSSFRLWESIDREENVLRSGPISIGLLRKVFRRLWRAHSIYLILSSGRLASCKGWIAVFPKRTLLAFGTDSSSLFGTVSRVTGCSASLFSAQ